MRYNLLTAAALLAQTQAASIPMPFGMGSVPISGNTNGHNTNGNGNVGSGMGMNHVNYYSADAASSMATPSSMVTPAYMAPSSMGGPAPSMMPQYPALSAYQHKHHHYHMTPMASSASHYMNMHMSMHMSASASASKSIHISYTPVATPSPSPSRRPASFNSPNNALHAPHPHEGFNVPQGIPKTPDFTSENGASSQPGGYHGGNGNGFTQTHGGSDDGSSNGPAFYSDGSGPAMPGMPGPPAEPEVENPGVPSPASFGPSVPESEHVNQNVAPVPGTRPGEDNIAPVDSMAPGTNVAPTQPQKSHGADIGNAFCMGDCYASKSEAKCQQPYVSFHFPSIVVCLDCC